MKVTIGNNGPVSSDDRPIMIRFTPDEIAHIKSMSDSDDLFIAHPNHWPKEHYDRWAKANSAAMSAGSKVVIRPSDDDSYVSDDEMNALIQGNNSNKTPPSVDDNALLDVLGIDQSENISSNAEDSTVNDDEILTFLGVPATVTNDVKTEVSVGGSFDNVKNKEQIEIWFTYQREKEVMVVHIKILNISKGKVQLIK